jgi:transposase-like protein
MEPTSIMSLVERVPDEASAYLLLEEMRWGDTPVCPHCGSERVYFLNPANGATRKTTRGTMSPRRVWKCGACRKQFSVTTGTIFHGTKIPLRKWILVVFEMCASKNGVAAREIERKYDLTNKSAWYMLHRIREAMQQQPMMGLLSGDVVADETWIGGAPKNKHGKGPGKGSTDKQPVVSLVDVRTGEVRSQVVPNVTSRTIGRVIEEHVDMVNTVLHTDSAPVYRTIAPLMAGHQTTNHFLGEYVGRTGSTTNRAEGFFSQLKRSLDGTHHHVSVEHLHRYLGEFDYRYNTCKLSDGQRMAHLMGRTKRRLSLYPTGY